MNRSVSHNKTSLFSDLLVLNVLSYRGVSGDFGSVVAAANNQAMVEVCCFGSREFHNNSHFSRVHFSGLVKILSMKGKL